jgi:hypothetical protein
MTFDPNRPDQELLPLPPEGVELETRPVLMQAIAASGGGWRDRSMASTE